MFQSPPPRQIPEFRYLDRIQRQKGTNFNLLHTRWKSNVTLENLNPYVSNANENCCRLLNPSGSGAMTPSCLFLRQTPPQKQHTTISVLLNGCCCCFRAPERQDYVGLLFLTGRLSLSREAGRCFYFCQLFVCVDALQAIISARCDAKWLKSAAAFVHLMNLSHYLRWCLYMSQSVK